MPIHDPVIQPRTSGLLLNVRAQLNLLRNLLMGKALELKPDEGAELVRVLKEPLEAELRSIKGTAAVAQRKMLSQAKELKHLIKVHTETKENLARTTRERDLAKTLLRHAGYYNIYLAALTVLPDEKPARITGPADPVESDPWWCSSCGVIHAPLAHVRDQRQRATDIPQTSGD